MNFGKNFRWWNCWFILFCLFVENGTEAQNCHSTGVGVAVVGEFLYAIGGFDDSSPLDSVEKYDPRTNQWTYVASMTTCRGGVGAGAMGGRLWAVGGHNGEQYLNSVESYNPLADLWEEGALMHVFRAGSGVVGSFCDVEVLRNSQDAINHRLKVDV